MKIVYKKTLITLFSLAYISYFIFFNRENFFSLKVLYWLIVIFIFSEVVIKINGVRLD